jgi:hypothetical protein
VKKRIAMVLVLAGLVAVAGFAAGGKNQIRHCGDNGQGSVVQHQVQVMK